MAKLRRVQILVEPEQYAQLEREADRRGGSVASVIRDAIDRLLPDGPAMTRTEAADVLLDAAPVPVDDWDKMKDELLAPWHEQRTSAS
jgi:hypothetical protein